jgi:hypothetical protein
MSYELTGKLVAKFDVNQRTEKFKVREFVIEKSDDADGKFINYIKFQCVQDKTAMPDRFNIGDDVKVQFNLKGTRYEKEGKVSYFTNLDAWRMESVKLGQENNSNDVNYNDIPPIDNVDELPF